jgi:hypothetical protein
MNFPARYSFVQHTAHVVGQSENTNQNTPIILRIFTDVKESAGAL